MDITNTDFQVVLNEAQALVKTELDATEQVMKDIAEKAPRGVSLRIKNLIERKGKRIRSTLLCLLAASGEAKPEIKRIAHACAGIELLHLASLVHDDIIDSTDIRRGEFTAHKQWGNKIAVLVGDFILSQTMRSVINEECEEIPVALSDAADGLTAGEIMELDWTGKTDITFDRYIEIITGKTGALLDAAAQIGALYAGFPKTFVKECGKMGTYFGIAFQIIDDLLDFGVGAKNLDKAKFTDISNGLITLPLIFYFKSCTIEQRKEMEEFIAQAAKHDVSKQIIDRLKAKDCFQKARDVATKYLQEAIEISQKLPDSNYSTSLSSFFTSMEDRTN